MSRPLIITDCDEVLLHMVVPFAEWLDSEKHIHFDIESGDFAEALRHKHDGTVVMADRVWGLLSAFFDSEMHRQYPIDGAVAAMTALSDHADIIVLTNLLDHRAVARAQQLAAVGIDAPVYTNQGGKGRKLAALVADYAPSMTIFIDDLAHNHESVADHAGDVWRLHFVGEPRLAPHIAPCPEAHARLDDWPSAQAWIEAIITAGVPAPVTKDQPV